MRNMTRGAAALLTSAAVVVALSGTAEAKPAQDPIYGCDYGAVCIYPEGKSYTEANPTHKFWSYGAHNLSGQVNKHWVFNNQYGRATADLCKQYNGGDCIETIPEGYAFYRDLTPINSITLRA
ncbi:hypothetical protein PV367_15220 [Streptomyces europaeiscabiei]|uniref:Peptidase inhibitor family I36 n=1 Tax=Streptomyces europaeiscabiei TaxID=146819 RepID=A0AAJ2PP50_9ACTN|nr:MULTISPECIES: hypothetical protein [Streptomyces]KFF95722.1 hypothetical protein IQ62_40285 [Streptomyces scabiei]MDX3131103.1 hypothetical protein [Streptomyces europaeiscabiei]